MPSTTKVGSGSLGTVVTFTYTSPGDAGKGALVGWSLGTTSYVAGITVDPAYQLSIKTWSAPVSVTIVP